MNGLEADIDIFTSDKFLRYQWSELVVSIVKDSILQFSCRAGNFYAFRAGTIGRFNDKRNTSSCSKRRKIQLLFILKIAGRRRGNSCC